MTRRHKGSPGRLRAAAGLVFSTIAAFQANQGTLMAAGLAYFLLISTSPLFVVAIAVTSAILGHEEAQLVVMSRVQSALGADAAQAVTLMVQDVDIFAGGLAASLIALAVLFYGSTRAFAALQRSLDVIWEVPVVTSLRTSVLHMVRARALAFAMVLAMGLVILLTLAVDTVSASLILSLKGFTPLWGRVISVGERLVLFLVRIACLGMIYRGLPARHVPWRDVWPGSLLAVLLLSTGHSVIRRYVAYSGLRSAYGAAGSVLVLLLSFYFVALVVLLGAQFCKIAADRRQAARGKPQSLRG